MHQQMLVTLLNVLLDNTAGIDAVQKSKGSRIEQINFGK